MVEMLNALISSFYQIFAGSTFGLMLLGIAIGFSVGILPGLGGTTTLALMLPFVIKMTPVEAFAFLIGMAAVTGTTGDITSILFGVPGEAISAALILDGHPMAKKGEAGRALGANLMSSLIGSIFGAFTLALAIPIVRPLVFAFGSPELFMLTILGLTFVASLSGGVLLRGLIAGGIGLFLAVIGLDPQSGIERYTFGQTFLWDGIGLVPITIGFFAIPEIIDLAVQGSSIAGERVGKLGGVMEGIKDTFRHWKLVIRCSAIGTFTGILPGMGGAISQWLAYAHAVQSSPDRERFGKGAVEGVLGPGAANNSMFGGHLVTTIAFGVPVTASMALLLGAFLIQGLVPGPDMLMPEVKGGHLTLTFSFVWTLIISNAITVGICFLFLNRLVKVTQIRGNLLIPFILMLVFLGAFAEKNAFADLILVLIFGVLGWVMVQLDWPRPPLILGLVLGQLAEKKLFISSSIYGFAWLLRPGVMVLTALTLAGIIYPILQARWQIVKSVKGEPLAPIVKNHNGSRGLSFSLSTLFSFIIIVAVICALWQSRGFSFKTGLFPWAIGFPVLTLAVIQFVMDLIGRGGSSRNDQLVTTGPELPTGVIRHRTLGIFGWIIGFFVAIWLLGFPLGAPLCTFIQLKIGDRERWPITVLITVIVWAFIYGVFDRVLHTPFPRGQLFLWLTFFPL